MGDKYFVLWHDNDFDLALWVVENTVLQDIANRIIIRKIPKTNESQLLATTFTSKFDYSILPYIKFSKPDIMLQQIEGEESKLIMATEFMTQTPQHDHIFQRFERIYDISHQGVPTFFVFPRNKAKYERGRRSSYTKTNYRPNPLGIHAYLKTTKINKTPTLTFFWPDSNGSLRYDKEHPTAPAIDTQIQNWLETINQLVAGAADPFEISGIKKQLKFLRSQYPYLGEDFMGISHTKFIDTYKNAYGLTRLNIVDTKDAIKQLGLDVSKLDSKFMDRPKTCIFSYTSRALRTDPYCGFICGYRNLFCLDDNGIKQINLIHRPLGITAKKAGPLAAPSKVIKEDLNKCPLNQPRIDLEDLDSIKQHLAEGCIYNRSKAERIFGTVPDVNVFEDLIGYNRVKDE